MKEGVTGLLFPPGDAAALADRLETALRDPGLREKFSRNSVPLVREKFSAAIMGVRTLEYYQELICKRKL